MRSGPLFRLRIGDGVEIEDLMEMVQQMVAIVCGYPFEGMRL